MEDRQWLSGDAKSFGEHAPFILALTESQRSLMDGSFGPTL